MKYWQNQQKYDLMTALLISALAWLTPKAGLPHIISISVFDITGAARTWVGPLLTLVGMMSATTAFIFSVIDRGEFKEIKNSASEGQLWRIFSQNLFWLALSAIFCVFLAFWNGFLSSYIMYLTTFLSVMSCICLAKFVWVIRQIISVRISQAELHHRKR